MEVLDDPVPAGIDQDAVARVVYASRSRVDGPVHETLERIRQRAVRNNQPLDVHTALLHQAGWFLQWKEGPPLALREVMDRVARDPRHEQVRVVHASRGPRLLDGLWSMAVVGGDEPAAEMARRLEAVRAAMFRKRQYSPPEVWRRVSMPGRHGGGDDASDLESYQRVLVCSAVGTTSFEMVRWLGREHRQPVEHRRFAGLKLDVATESVDFRCCGRPLRLVAMARKGLSVPLTRALLAGYSHLVMLLCPDEQRNAMLLDRLVQACAGQDDPPYLIGVGMDPDGHAGLFTQARRLHRVCLGARADPRDYASTWSALWPLMRVWREKRHAGSPVGLPRPMR